MRVTRSSARLSVGHVPTTTTPTPPANPTPKRRSKPAAPDLQTRSASKVTKSGTSGPKAAVAKPKISQKQSTPAKLIDQSQLEPVRVTRSSGRRDKLAPPLSPPSLPQAKSPSLVPHTQGPLQKQQQIPTPVQELNNLQPKRGTKRDVTGAAKTKTINKKATADQSVKKSKHDPIKFERLTDNPIVESLKKVLRNKQDNIAAEILDQIALEGLEGITFDFLLNLLDAIFPELDCLKNETSQLYVWSILVGKYLQYPDGTKVRAYLLNQANRQKLLNQPAQQKHNSVRNDSQLSCDNGLVHSSPEPTDRNVTIEKSIRLPELAWKRISKWPLILHPIQEGDIVGSCEHYLARLDITQEILDKLGSLGTRNSFYEINNLYNLRSVRFVADQDLRRKTILPDWVDPKADIKLREYVCLEFIGRTRTYGAVFPNDKSFGRYRIILSAKGFITQYQQYVQSHIVHHLKRFADSSLVYVEDYAFNVRGIVAKKGSQDNDCDDGGDGDDDRDGDKPAVKRLCCNINRLQIDRDIFKMLNDVIAERNGRSLLDIRRKLKIPKSHIRNHLKNLINIELIGSHLKKVGDVNLRLYQTRYKSIKLKKKVAAKKQFKGVMKKWDEIDILAKEILGHKRSSFSQAEDSLLILCRIVSLLIDPTLKKLSYCVRKHLIRDLMHQEFVESHDKTGDACLRRIKYLRRLPHNLMSINELTTELQDDCDIIRLIESHKSNASRSNASGDTKNDDLFIQLLRMVRSKLPHLLGFNANAVSGPSTLAIQSGECLALTGANLVRASRKIHRMSGELIVTNNKRPTDSFGGVAGASRRDSLVIKSERELRENYELVDCQSVASIAHAPTYDLPKNVVDKNLNNVCLVTMAFTLTCNIQTKKSSQHDQHDEQQQQQRQNEKRAPLWLLDKFYSNYQDKLICSVLSKLNKRSLLTRKCPSEQATLYRPIKTRVSLKLNQSVLFLLNRYHSSSLMQLAHPISRRRQIDLRESNEMSSIALLTSLFSLLGSFNLDLDLKVPANVIGLDQGNENFKQLCRQANENTREVLARFFGRCGESLEVPNQFKPKLSRASATPANKKHGPNQSEGVSGDGGGACSPGDRAGERAIKKIRQHIATNSKITTAASTTTTMTPATVAVTTRRTRSAARLAGGEAARTSEKGPDPVPADTLDSSQMPPPPAPPARPLAASRSPAGELQNVALVGSGNQRKVAPASSSSSSTDSRRALFLLRHELRSQALDKCGDLSDALIVQPCSIRFSSQEELKVDKRPLLDFLERSRPIDLETADCESGGRDEPRAEDEAGATLEMSPREAGKSGKRAQKVLAGEEAARLAQLRQSSWLVRGFRLVEANKSSSGPRAELAPQPEASAVEPNATASEKELDARTVAIEYAARLWKSIDGSVHIETLFKLIETLLSWIIVFPGVELETLYRELGHLMPEEHLTELLELMKNLGLVSSERFVCATPRPRLFGERRTLEESERSARKEQPGSEVGGAEKQQRKSIVTYEPESNAYVKYCRLLDYVVVPT